MTIENNKILPIIEVYRCIQGEGPYVGVPHILIRFTGCPLRCQFGNSFCDTPYASWKPEKGNFTFEDILKVYQDNPQISYTLITGGSPTIHAELLKDLTHYISKHFNHLITIETEGTKFVEGLSPSCMISLSPKLASSKPTIGLVKPFGGEVTEYEQNLHEKNRANYDEMKKLIDTYGGWLKPVINGDTFQNDIEEVKKIQEILGIDNDNVYLMPAGMNEEQLRENRKTLVRYCIKNGYNYTDRLHVVIYGEKRGV